MSDSAIVTQTVSPPGTDLDAEKLPNAGPVGEDIFRERVQVTGATLPEIARVENVQAAVKDYGLVVREIANLNDLRIYDLLQQMLVTMKRVEYHLSVLSDEHFKGSENVY